MRATVVLASLLFVLPCIAFAQDSPGQGVKFSGAELDDDLDAFARAGGRNPAHAGGLPWAKTGHIGWVIGATRRKQTQRPWPLV